MAAVGRLFAVTVDCPDPFALARFYQSFTGWEVDAVSDDFVILSGGDHVRIDFQKVPNSPPPTWPDPRAPRRVHLDFEVDDLDAADAHVIEQGAVLADFQPDRERFRVFLDSAGHPFCLVDKAARPTPGITVRPMRDQDADRVLAIYQQGLDSGQASFEITAPSWEEFDAAKLTEHRHVAVGQNGDVLGWAAVVPVSSRCVYAGVVEHSVYVDPRAQGRGIGQALLQALIQSTEAAGIWTIQSGIFPENRASLRLHERAGFRVVGTRTRVGRHHGRWRDVVLLERRSPTV
jgi:L-amino acid N-acyltransferase YncA